MSSDVNSALNGLSINNFDRGDNGGREDTTVASALSGCRNDSQCVCYYYVVDRDGELVDDRVVFSDEDEIDGWHAYDDADSDSNGETNWRYDYPDEEESSSDGSGDEDSWREPYRQRTFLVDESSKEGKDSDSDGGNNYW